MFFLVFYWTTQITPILASEEVNLLFEKNPIPVECVGILEELSNKKKQAIAAYKALADRLIEAGDDRGTVLYHQLELYRVLNNYEYLGPLAYTAAPIIPRHIPKHIVKSWFPYLDYGKGADHWFPSRIHAHSEYLKKNWQLIRQILPKVRARFTNVPRPYLQGQDLYAMERLGKLLSIITKEHFMESEENLWSHIPYSGHIPMRAHLFGGRTLILDLYTKSYQPVPFVMVLVHYGENETRAFMTNSTGQIHFPQRILNTFHRMELLGF